MAIKVAATTAVRLLLLEAVRAGSSCFAAGVAAGEERGDVLESTGTGAAWWDEDRGNDRGSDG
jgi:hypothetical protein